MRKPFLLFVSLCSVCLYSSLAALAQGFSAPQRLVSAAKTAPLITQNATLYAASGDEKYLREAQFFAKSALAAVSFSDVELRAAPASGMAAELEASRALGVSLLQLYSVSADRQDLKAAEGAADYILDYQPIEQVISAAADAQMAANIELVRFMNLLGRYSGKATYRDFAQRAFELLAKGRRADVLALEAELRSEPLHITVVGHKDDPAALPIFKEALKYPATYKRTEWWDKREGAMLNPDVDYPEFAKAAAFVCTNKRCSLPIFSAERIPVTIKMLSEDQK